jgi:homoserine dehydrogenase
MLPVVILKFGSSVLATADDIPVAVDEIYRRLREGTRVLAVVSAFAGETNHLFSRAWQVLGDNAAPEAVAAFVATGEMQSAALLVGALRGAGVAARLVDPREIDLRVAGPPLEADPVSIDTAALRALWETNTSLVLPGFFGIDAEDRIALLGRGGSDLSALFIAGACGAECHLVKDVPGVFDRDPAADGSHARRYAVIPWHEASIVAGPLIQPKALAYAEQHRLPFTVSRANGTLETRVAEVPSAVWGLNGESAARLRVALLGCGTVGGGVYERLRADADRFDVVAVVTRHREWLMVKGIPAAIASDDLDRALAPDVDLVIECLGGVEPAGSMIEAALARGKFVVTANKAVIAAYSAEFASAMREPDRRLWFGAAAGGAVPMLETLASLSEEVAELCGVINGTCNSVLDALALGQSLEEAVRAAQVAGFAETDPSRDLSGADAADKLSLLAQAAFGMRIQPGQICTRGIERSLVADKTNVWRLIARAVRAGDGLILRVAPEMLVRGSFLAETAGAENRLEITLASGEVVRLAGQGAGRWPTTLAVLGDVYEIVRKVSYAASSVLCSRAHVGRQSQQQTH